MRTERGDEQSRELSPLRRLSSWQTLANIAFLGIGVLSVLLAYLALQNPEPRVDFETISDTNVLDVHRPLQDLAIVFRGQNVQEQNLNLRIVTVNVANSGEVNILPSHYDNEVDWGMKFNGGEVIEARLVDTNSEYLRSRIVPQRLGADTVTFPKIIFEKGKSFAIEVLLLHSKNESPSISSVGKIAGIDKITVLERPLTQQEVGFVSELFQGSAIIQVARMIFYFAASVISIIASTSAAIGIETLYSKHKGRMRRQRILKTRTVRQLGQGEMSNFLITHFESTGTPGLRALQDVVTGKQGIMWISSSGNWMLRTGHEDGDSAMAALFHDYKLRLSTERAVNELTTMGIFERGEGDNAVIDPVLIESVDSLLVELDS